MYFKCFNTNIPINSLFDEFLGERDIVSKSAETYKSVLKVFVTWLTQNIQDIRSPSVKDITMFKRYLINKQHKASTIDSYMRIIGLWFKWLEFKNYYSNITLGIHSCKKYYGHRKGYLLIPEVNYLLKNIKTETLIEKRNFAIINLMVRTGLRCIEVSRLDIQDIKYFESNYSFNLQRKGSIEKDQVFGFSTKVFEPIQSYLSERINVLDTDPLFINIGNHKKEDRISASEVGRVVTTELIRSGLKRKDISTHSLRHTFAISAYKAKVPLLNISIALGHRSLSTTQIYVSAIDSETLKLNPAVSALDTVYE